MLRTTRPAIRQEGEHDAFRAAADLDALEKLQNILGAGAVGQPTTANHEALEPRVGRERLCRLQVTGARGKDPAAAVCAGRKKLEAGS